MSFLLRTHRTARLYTLACGGGERRTHIVIDDALLKEAMQTTGRTTKRAVVEAGLRLLVQIQAQTYQL